MKYFAAFAKASCFFFFKEPFSCFNKMFERPFAQKKQSKCASHPHWASQWLFLKRAVCRHSVHVHVLFRPWLGPRDGNSVQRSFRWERKELKSRQERRQKNTTPPAAPLKKKKNNPIDSAIVHAEWNRLKNRPIKTSALSLLSLPFTLIQACSLSTAGEGCGCVAMELILYQLVPVKMTMPTRVFVLDPQLLPTQSPLTGEVNRHAQMQMSVQLMLL